MTVLIKLTRPACAFYPEGKILVNPANITQIYRGADDRDGTYVEMNSGNTRMVIESPEEIAEMIFKAEHPLLEDLWADPSTPLNGDYLMQSIQRWAKSFGLPEGKERAGS